MLWAADDLARARSTLFVRGGITTRPVSIGPSAIWVRMHACCKWFGIGGVRLLLVGVLREWPR